MACNVGPHDFVNIKVFYKRCLLNPLDASLLSLRLASRYPLPRMESYLAILVRPCTRCLSGIMMSATAVVYDVAGSGADRSCVVLNNIHIDIMDYIQPASCTDTEFRKMWAEFEWENKITVNTNLSDLNGYLEHLLASTNMHCLTPKQALTGGCGFLAANLYARSIFGEDALANVSIEKPLNTGNEAPVQGHVRIRAKTQVTSVCLVV